MMRIIKSFLARKLRIKLLILFSGILIFCILDILYVIIMFKVRGGSSVRIILGTIMESLFKGVIGILVG